MNLRILAVLAGIGVSGFVAGLVLDWPALRLLAKPLPVLCLMLWIWRVPGLGLVRVGLALGLLGDVLLELRGFPAAPEQSLFLAGLAAFLGAHLCYLGACLRRSSRGAWLLALPFAIWGLLLISAVLPRLGSMALPVMVYSTAVCLMMWRAWAVSSPGGWPLLGLGAVIFGVSDSLIALNMFYQPIDHARPAIILSYWLGQWGIVLGARRQLADRV